MSVREKHLEKRLKVLDAACAKHHDQERRDQAYIDLLERRLRRRTISKIREEVRGLIVRHGCPVCSADMSATVLRLAKQGHGRGRGICAYPIIATCPHGHTCEYPMRAQR